MSIKIKKGPKIVLGILAIVGIIMLLKSPMVMSHLPSNFQKAVKLGKVDMPNIQDAQIQNPPKPVPYPSTDTASVPATLIRAGIWEWNAQAGFLFANGGKQTTKGSLMEKYGVNLNIERQDDTGKMGEGLMACASELKDGAKQCSNGYNFVIIMGGGVPQFTAGLNDKLTKLGPEYRLKVIGAVGRSNGEDAFMAPASLKSDPHSISTLEMTDSNGTVQETKGALFAGVIRDDDWNIAQKWGGDNNVPNNPDEKTFDPDAMNWLNSSDYNQAAQDFVSHKCEDRTLVKDGHSTGKKVHVCVNGVVTWTPGDVVSTTKRGGVVKIASSKNYLMPSVIIGPGKFFNDNREEISGMLAAIFAGSDQVRAYDAALRKASAIAGDIYADQGDQGDSNGGYWYKYFKGVTQRDSTGQNVELGGSAVYGLEDNLALFGIKDGSNDNFRSIYNVFSGIDMKQYPALFKSSPIPSVSDVEVKSYIRDAQDKLSGTTVAEASTVNYSAAKSGSILGNRSYSINFATGSATPLPDGMALINELKDSLAVTRASIEVNGHTDSTGNEVANQELSQRRAQAVVDTLHRLAPASFPLNRFEVHGYGSQQPVADNNTAAGKAQNRRVQIILRGE